MKIVDRYLLREYLKPVLWCMALFSMLFVVYDLFDRFPDFLKAGTPAWKVLIFYANYLPAYQDGHSLLVVALPVSLLAGALYSLSQLTRHNELTAMRASGMSLARLMRPYVAVGFAASLLAAAVQETAAPLGNRWIARYTRSVETKDRPRHIKHDAITPFNYYNPVARVRWEVPVFSPHTPETLRFIKVIIERPGGLRDREIYADRAEWLDGHWWFHRMSVQRYDEFQRPLGPRSHDLKHPVEMRELTETPDHFLAEAGNWDSLPAHRMYQYLRLHRAGDSESAAASRVDFHGRLAAPWMCLIVTLIGVPMCARSSRQGVFTVVLAAFLLFFVFYLATYVGMFLGKKLLVWPWLGAWLPNIVFVSGGAIMLGRMK